MAAERESRQCSQTEDLETGDHFGTAAREKTRVERVDKVEGVLPT